MARLIDADALGIGRCNPDAFPLQNRGYCAGWNGVIQLIEEAPAVDAAPKWILVTERLPDNNHPVLVRCVNTTISGGYVTHIGSCDMKKFWFLRTQPGTASFPVQEWQVTHWMPLPEPPKEEER